MAKKFRIDNPALAKLLKGARPAPRGDFDVACIYYPGFHSTPFMEAWHGFGWSEWDITYRCKPRFKGHRQPILPKWGASTSPTRPGRRGRWTRLPGRHRRLDLRLVLVLGRPRSGTRPWTAASSTPPTARG